MSREHSRTTKNLPILVSDESLIRGDEVGGRLGLGEGASEAEVAGYTLTGRTKGDAVNTQERTARGKVRAEDRRAVVVGGSMAGLLAARVLAEHFERVTVVDRDRFPEVPDHRKGVPQSLHAHGILPRGQEIIGRLFPEIEADLRADGAPSAGGKYLAVISPAGRLPLGPLEGGTGRGSFASRFLLEWHVRRRLATYEGVEFLADHDVVGLAATEDNVRVVGVNLRRRGGGVEPWTLQADLVVDASGRNSRSPRWLQELGYEAPPEETIDSGIGYASRFYKKPINWPVDWEGIIVNGRPPDNPRAGLILPIEDGKWHVTVGGFAGHHPPTDEAGFLEWAKGLPDPSVHEAIRVAEPLTPIRAYRTPRNRLRRFERLPRWPENFIVTGDAVCAFNPIYGQGVTVSAMDAELLEKSLGRKGALGGAKPGFARRFQKDLAKVVATPWMIASSEDLRWGVESSGVGRTLINRLVHRYTDLVLRRAIKDARVAHVYWDVVGLIAPSRALFGRHVLPGVISEVLGRVVSGFGRKAPAPKADSVLSPETIDASRTWPAVRFGG